MRWRAGPKKANTLQPFDKCANPLSETLVDLVISQRLPILIPSSLGLRSSLWLFSGMFSPKQSWWYTDPSAWHGAREIMRSYIFTLHIPYIVMCIRGQPRIHDCKQNNKISSQQSFFFLPPLVELCHSSRFFSFSRFYSTEVDNWRTILWMGEWEEKFVFFFFKISRGGSLGAWWLAFEGWDECVEGENQLCQCHMTSTHMPGTHMHTHTECEM